MTKGRHIKNFVKSQPLFGVHQQYLYSLVTVLHLESFENNLFELDFLISKRKLVSMVKPGRKVNSFHGYDIFFSRLLLLFIY